jgi:acetylornithine deacetylase/succinyl-diaminopimelate desuccinylase-like protein
MKPLLVLLALAVAGCGDERAEPKSATGPLVTYERGGGFAYQPRRVVVQRDGRARLTVETHGKATHTSFTVPADRLAEIERALADARGIDAPRTQTGCADCFTYEVKADGVDFAFDDVSLEQAPPELRRVVGVLQEISD